MELRNRPSQSTTRRVKLQVLGASGLLHYTLLTAGFWLLLPTPVDFSVPVISAIVLLCLVLAGMMKGAWTRRDSDRHYIAGAFVAALLFFVSAIVFRHAMANPVRELTHFRTYFWSILAREGLLLLGLMLMITAVASAGVWLGRKAVRRA
jgi:hypothetical protein